MLKIHNLERAQFEKLFIQEDIDNIENRLKILDAFLQTENHVTVRELTQYLNENGCQLDIEFVRDTLKLLCFYGFAQKSRFDNGHIRYEHRHLGQHHDHMICTKCRKIFEFQNESLERLQEQIAREQGFHMLQHKMEIYGICSECLEMRLAQISLAAAKPGERLTIQDFTGGRNSRLRLRTWG